jgi:hypothetical protein
VTKAEQRGFRACGHQRSHCTDAAAIPDAVQLVVIPVELAELTIMLEFTVAVLTSRLPL